MRSPKTRNEPIVATAANCDAEHRRDRDAVLGADDVADEADHLGRGPRRPPSTSAAGPAAAAAAQRSAAARSTDHADDAGRPGSSSSGPIASPACELATRPNAEHGTPRRARAATAAGARRTGPAVERHEHDARRRRPPGQTATPRRQLLARGTIEITAAIAPSVEAIGATTPTLPIRSAAVHQREPAHRAGAGEHAPTPTRAAVQWAGSALGHRRGHHRARRSRVSIT